jgi:hypothetical protein
MLATIFALILVSSHLTFTKSKGTPIAPLEALIQVKIGWLCEKPVDYNLCCTNPTDPAAKGWHDANSCSEYAGSG